MSQRSAPRPKLVDTLRSFAAELREGLRGDPELGEQVRELEIFGRCECRDSFCATFYTAPRPDGSYGPGHRNVVVDVKKGMVILDVVEGRIACVEVLYRGDVRSALAEAYP